MEIEWGPEIAVDGKRPEWLGDELYGFRINDGGWWNEAGRQNGPWPEAVTAIRLPASHPAYLAISRGFTPWGGGDGAPGDWDEGEVLFNNGETDASNNGGAGWNWARGDWVRVIIGYRREPIVEAHRHMINEFLKTLPKLSPQPIGGGTVTGLSIKVDTTELKATIAATATYTVTRDGLTITGPDLAHILRSIKEDGNDPA